MRVETMSQEQLRQMAESFQLDTHPGSDPSVLVISITGPMVLEHLFKFQTAWREATADRGVVFDLAAVPYMDSSAIGSLVNAHVHFANRGKKMVLAGASPRLKEILHVTRVDSIFKFFPTISEAEESISQKVAGA